MHCSLETETREGIGETRVLTAVVTISISWDITSCSPLKVNQRFEEHDASIFRVHNFPFYAFSPLYVTFPHNVGQSVENKPTFRRNISPPPSGSSNKPKKNYFLHAGFLLDILFDPEEGGDILLKTSIDFERTTRRYIPEIGPFTTTAIRTSNPKQDFIVMISHILYFFNKNI
jgi:hypothetical protein